MSAPNSTPAAVELPPAFDHWTTSGRAQTWEAYDALTPDDGWKETARYDSETGDPRSWKEGEIRGHRITVHAPRGPRPAPRLSEGLLESALELTRVEEALDRDDNRPLSEPELMRGYGLAVKADELARKRRVPHALKRDLGVD